MPWLNSVFACLFTIVSMTSCLRLVSINRYLKVYSFLLQLSSASSSFDCCRIEAVPATVIVVSSSSSIPYLSVSMLVSLFISVFFPVSFVHLSLYLCHLTSATIQCHHPVPISSGISVSPCCHITIILLILFYSCGIDGRWKIDGKLTKV